MKKLLNILTSVTLIGSAATSVAACGGGEKKDPDLSTMQQEMLNGAEFISRLIVAGRHENLNYNVNEILSIFLTPTPTAMNMPISYNYEGKSINMAANINKFKNYLAPSLNYYNGDNYAGMFASYLMGMYEDDFYNEIINGKNGEYYFRDTFSKAGDQGYNKKNSNAMGYGAGLGKDINLSKNQDRRNLAWGIQDTGALSNYLLNLGFDGANPTDTNGTSSPKTSAGPNKGGTNGSGYAWYNSILMNNGATKSADYSQGWNAIGIPLTKGKLKGTDFKAADDELKSSINGIRFNSTGALITKVAGEQNINGFISMFGSMLENLSDTKNGALLTGEFINILFPMIRGEGVTNAATIMQAVGLSLIYNVWSGIKEINSELVSNPELSEIIERLDEPKKLFTSVPIVGDLPVTENIKVEALYKMSDRDKSVENHGTNAKDIVSVIETLTEIYNSYSNKQDFNDKFFINNDAPFYKSYSLIRKYIGEENWKDAMNGKNNDGGINLLNFAKQAFEMLTEKEVIDKFDSIVNAFDNKKSFRELSSVEKNNYLKLLGWNEEEGYIEGSLSGRIYNAMTNPEVHGQRDFKKFFDSFKYSVENAMGELHKPVLQYLTDDKYWKVNNFTINTTSNTQRAGKMEFDLNYTGNGDVTSNASKQTKKVEVNEKFNPYQTIAENQKKNWKPEIESKLDKEKIENSGQILGLKQQVVKEDELLKYDGLGNHSDYKPVNNSYKIVWENISKNPDSPYWVITSLKSFNASGQEFYNIY
ncbi:lipoprotein [Spiroplasma endosymbiont of Dioctria linearis]|uniref:lipoprotein n=1 Tax=Spiroplasma endosymbiont of Dioctria linearis TaxID=3066290 RepID=UPI00313CE04A